MKTYFAMNQIKIYIKILIWLKSSIMVYIIIYHDKAHFWEIRWRLYLDKIIR